MGVLGMLEGVNNLSLCNCWVRLAISVNVFSNLQDISQFQ